MLSPPEIRVFSTLPKLLGGGFGLFQHGMRSDLEYAAHLSRLSFVC